MSKIRRVLLTILALALLRLPLETLLAVMLPDAAVDPVPQLLAGAGMCLLLLGLPAWLLRPWTSIRLRRGNSAGWELLLAGAAALLIRAALSPVDGAWQGWLGLSPDAIPAPDSIPVALMYIAALAVVPAVAEEAFFRGTVLTSLLDGSRRITAVLLTTLTFVLMHGSAANLPSLLTLSLLLTLLMLHTGRIAVPVTAHLVYNLTALVDMPVPLWGSGLCGAGIIALGAYLCIRQPKYAHPPMKGLDGLIAAATVAVLAATYIA